MKMTCCSALLVKNPPKISPCYCFSHFWVFYVAIMKRVALVKNKVQSKDKILQTAPRSFVYFYLKKLVKF